MIPIKLNMEELLEAVSLEEDNLGKNFLDTCTGEIIYIPTEVALALENGTLKEENFDEWLQEFVSLAILIQEDKEKRYLRTPILNDDFYIDIMQQYTNTVITNANLKLELHKALNSEESIKNFKHVLMDKENEIDEWYLYEDKCVEEYIKQWLKLNQLQFKL